MEENCLASDAEDSRNGFILEQNFPRRVKIIIPMFVLEFPLLILAIFKSQFEGSQILNSFRDS